MSFTTSQTAKDGVLSVTVGDPDWRHPSRACPVELYWQDSRKHLWPDLYCSLLRVGTEIEYRTRGGPNVRVKSLHWHVDCRWGYTIGFQVFDFVLRFEYPVGADAVRVVWCAPQLELW